MTDSPNASSPADPEWHLFESTHPLDDPNFDPVQYLNQTYAQEGIASNASHQSSATLNIPPLGTLHTYETLHKDTEDALRDFLMKQKRMDFSNLMHGLRVESEQQDAPEPKEGDSAQEMQGDGSAQGGAADSNTANNSPVLHSISTLSRHLVQLIQEFNHLTDSLQKLTILKDNIHTSISYLNKYQLLNQSLQNILKHLEMQNRRGLTDVAQDNEHLSISLTELMDLSCSALALAEQFNFSLRKLPTEQQHQQQARDLHVSTSHALTANTEDEPSAADSPIAALMQTTTSENQDSQFTQAQSSESSSQPTKNDASTVSNEVRAEMMEKLTKVRNFILDTISHEMRHRVRLSQLGDLSWLKSVDSLEPYDPGLRESIIKDLVKVVMREYKNAFKKSKDPEKNLASIPSRLKWMKRRLSTLHAKYGNYIPSEWCIRQEIVVAFALHIRKFVERLLNSSHGDLNVSQLYKALQNTIAFERSMHEKFHTTQPTRGQNSPSAPNQKMYNFTGFISPVFSKHMQTAYVNHEKVNMEQVVSNLMDECFSEQDFLMDTFNTQNAQDLFIAIEQSCNNCTSFNNSNILFGLLQDVWKYNLNRFANFLAENIQQTITSETTSRARHVAKKIFSTFSRSTDKNASQQFVHLKEKELHRICHIIHLSEYCQQEVTAVEDMVSDSIDQTYKQRVSLSEERSGFLRVIKSARDTLVDHILCSMEPYIEKMMNANWSSPECIEESSYCTDIANCLQENLTPLMKKLPDQYYKTTCQSFVFSFLSLYEKSMFKLENFTIEGAHQLLMDLIFLRNLFRDLLPSQNFDAEEIGFFHKNIARLTRHMEALLKVLSTDSSQLLQSYKSMIPHRDRSTVEFLRLLNLRVDIDKNERELLRRADFG